MALFKLVQQPQFDKMISNAIYINPDPRPKYTKMR